MVLRCCIPGLATALPPHLGIPRSFFKERKLGFYLLKYNLCSIQLLFGGDKCPQGRTPFLRSAAASSCSEARLATIVLRRPLSWSVCGLWRFPWVSAKLQLVLRGLRGVGRRKEPSHRRNPAEGRHKMFPTSDRKPIHTLPCSQEIKLIFHFLCLRATQLNIGI